MDLLRDRAEFFLVVINNFLQVLDHRNLKSLAVSAAASAKKRIFMTANTIAMIVKMSAAFATIQPIRAVFFCFSSTMLSKPFPYADEFLTPDA